MQHLRGKPVKFIQKFLFQAYQCLLRVWNHPACTVRHFHDVNTTERTKDDKRKRTNNGAKVTVGQIMRELTGSYRRYLQQSAQLMSDVEERAHAAEEAMMNALAGRGKNGRGDILDDDDDDDDIDEGDDRSVGSIADFIVDDDVVEYEDGDGDGMKEPAG